MSQRAGRELDCFVAARAELGTLPTDTLLYWHIDAYADRASAESAEGPRSAVVESLGRVWLFTITDARWRPGARAGSGLRILYGRRVSTADAYDGPPAPGRGSLVHRVRSSPAWDSVAWRLSELYGERNDEESAATILQALDLGINFLDPADTYGIGDNEDLIGKTIRGRRDEVFIATTFGAS